MQPYASFKVYQRTVFVPKGSCAAVKFLVFSFVLIQMIGCSGWQPRPDLHRLYDYPAANSTQPPLILIPGMMGTRLADVGTGREIWPQSAGKIMISRYRELELEVGSTKPALSMLKPTTLTDQVAGRDFYQSITMTLEQDAGYQLAQIGHPPPEGRIYYVFAYDWRQDLQQSAAKLDEFVRVIRQDRGDPDLKVDLLAHSMGGLIAR
jgi:hypothetical protein